MTPSHNATQASRHVAKFNGSQVDMQEVSSRELSCKRSQTIRRASTSRARNLVQRPSCPIRGSSGGRQERQEARLEAILNAMRPVQRPSWTPGGSSAGRLGRQEARMQVLLQFCCKMQVLRSWQQEARLPHREAPIAEFLYRCGDKIL